MGGMAVVHLGRLLGSVGFARTVAIKRVHAHLAHDRDFVAMFVDEAHLAARIHHPNVVPTLDVVVDGGEVLLVMEYVHGESLSNLTRLAHAESRLPLRVGSAILTGVLHGLHAAHEARSEQGELLGLVHRDVSPQNVLVGVDGAARVLDFGVAKASGRLQTTREGRVKGKLAYMAPEQLLGEPLTRRADLYSASVLAWEVVTGRRLFLADNEGAMTTAILNGRVVPPSAHVPDIPPALEALILRGLERDPMQRFETAREMALALESCVPPALGSEVGTLVERLAGRTLEKRARAVALMERGEGPALEHPASHEMDALAQRSDGTTQSQLSVNSALDAKSASRSTKLRVAAVIGLLAVGVPVAALLLTRHGSTSSPPTAAAATNSAMVSDPSVPPSSESAPPDLSASRGPLRDSAPAKTHSGPPGRNPHTPAPASSRASCNPPFTVDSIGRRIYRRDCF